MEFGIPYKIPLEFVDEYKKSKRETIAKLLKRINEVKDFFFLRNMLINNIIE